jgi:hypothetical protein
MLLRSCFLVPPNLSESRPLWGFNVLFSVKPTSSWHISQRDRVIVMGKSTNRPTHSLGTDWTLNIMWSYIALTLESAEVRLGTCRRVECMSPGCMNAVLRYRALAVVVCAFHSLGNYTVISHPVHFHVSHSTSLTFFCWKWLWNCLLNCHRKLRNFRLRE